MLAQCIEHQPHCPPYSLGEALGCPTALLGRAVEVFRGGLLMCFSGAVWK